MHTLDIESTRLLVDSRLQSADLVRLRLLKARVNLAKLIEFGISDEEALEIEDRLLSVEFNAISRCDDITESQPVKETANVIDELNILSGDARLRRRKVDSIEVQQSHQEQLSSDLVEMAAAIKRNAKKFQEKLDTDSDLMSTTGDAIQRTAGSMTNVASKLKKYHSESLGWRFYLGAALFIIVAAFLGMGIIQVFGKW